MTLGEHYFFIDKRYKDLLKSISHLSNRKISSGVALVLKAAEFRLVREALKPASMSVSIIFRNGCGFLFNLDAISSDLK